MISIVIQGPLNSRDYDCRANILRLINEFISQKFIDDIYVSTWKKNDFIETLDKITYIQNVSPTFSDNMNRYKQFYSVNRAVLMIKEKGISTFILKIRTDQFISPSIIQFIIEFYNKSDFDKDKLRNQQDYIISSHSYNCIPYFIGDFYFAGRVDDILLYTSTYNRYKNFCHQWLPEVDIVIKYMEVLGVDTRLGLFKYLNIHTRSDVSLNALNRWNSIFTNRFSLFPQAIFDTLEWRGEKFANDLHDYQSEWQLAKNNLDIYLANNLHQYNSPNIKRRLKDYIIFILRILNFKGI
jgi:hypothetical protein